MLPLNIMNITLANPETGKFKYFWTVVLLVIGLTILIKIPTLNLPHVEGDEIAFWHLANNWIKTGKYTDKGDDLTPYPAYIDRFTRDMPVHPPVFAALLVPFAKYQALSKAVIASWVGHILAILAVALIGRHILRRSPDVDAFSPVFWLPLLGVATDPVMTWISGILWIDNLDAGFAALVVAFALIARDSRKPELMWTIAGIVLGLGLLSKVTVAVIIPVVGYLIYQLPGTRERIVAGLCFAVPALLLSLPWYVPLFFTMHEFIFPKPHLAPGVYQAPPCPFCEITTSRPIYYFFLKVCLVSPLILVCVGFLALAFGKKKKEVKQNEWQDLLFPFAWFLLVMLLATFAGSFIMRRISIVFPAMYVMMFYLAYYFHGHAELRRYQSMMLLMSGMAIVYGAIGGAFYLFHGNYAEYFSQIELAGIINLWGAR